MITKLDNLTMLGLCMLNTGEPIESLKLLHEALSIANIIEQRQPGNQEILNYKNKVLNNLGNAYRKIKDYDNSFKFYLMCSHDDKNLTYPAVCFNLGTLLLARWDLAPALKFFAKAMMSQNEQIKTYVKSRGLFYFYEDPLIFECVLLYFKKKYNNSIILIKKIYLRYHESPVLNFFLAFSYLSIGKVKKAECFFSKLMKINELFNFEIYPIFKKLIFKAKLITKKLPELEKENDESYLQEIVSFVDLPYISQIEDYTEIIDESISNKINTEVNVLFKQSQRTKILTELRISSKSNVNA